jgi:hypothetical protein
MVLAHLDPVPAQLGREQDDEGIALVLVELRPLVAVPDVLEGQLVELEGFLEQGIVVGARILDVEPEALLALPQAGREGLRSRLDPGAFGGDQIAGDGLRSPLPPPAAGEGAFLNRPPPGGRGKDPGVLI